MHQLQFSDKIVIQLQILFFGGVKELENARPRKVSLVPLFLANVIEGWGKD
jgi:hypothetical protein